MAHPFQPGHKLPVYVANFVLMEYGAGAIFGCPGHDQRDLEFARKYGLDVIPVVCPPQEDPATYAIGDEGSVNGPATDAQVETMARLAREAVEAGAVREGGREEEGEDFSINTETDNQLNYAIKLFTG